MTITDASPAPRTDGPPPGGWPDAPHDCSPGCPEEHDPDGPTRPEYLQPVEAAVEVRYGASALTVRSDQRFFTSEQLAAFAAIGIPGDAPAPYVAAFFHLCQATGVDPFLKQATLIRTKDGWAPIITFNGLKGLAERTREFQGFEPLEYWSDTAEEFMPVWRPRRMGQAHPDAVRASVRRGPSVTEFTLTTAVVNWEEYAVHTNRIERVVDGVPRTIFLPPGEEVLDWWWASKGPLMLGKVGKAAATRDAFPQACGAWWVEDEMGRAQQEGQSAERDEAAARRSTGRRAAYAAATDGTITRNSATTTAADYARHLRDSVLRSATAARTLDDDSGLTAAFDAAHFPSAPEPAPASQDDTDPGDTQQPATGQDSAPEGALTEDDYRRLVLAELAWQAGKLGRTVEDLTARTRALRTEPLEQWPSRVILQLVSVLRSAVARRLEEDEQRFAEAAAYRSAPRDEIATIGELLRTAA